MKKYFFIILCFIVGSNLIAKDTLALQQDIEQLRHVMKDSIQQIGKRVDNGAETLKIAKEYAGSADKMISNFYGFLGVIATILGISLFAVYRRSLNKFNQVLEKKFAEQQKEIDRVLSTEKSSIYIKDNAHIMVIHKDSHDQSSGEFKKLEETIFNEFENPSHISANDLNELTDKLAEFVKIDAPLKIILMNDDLFSDLETQKIREKWEFTAASKDIINGSFDLLKTNEVGLVLFGRTYLDAFKLPYLAFSNQPYSTYTNVNNLLKYMMVAKKIKP